MRYKLHQLIRDTIDHVSSEEPVPTRRPMPERPPPAPRPEPAPPPKKEEPPTSKQMTPSKPRSAGTLLVTEKIQKHLPHVTLVAKVPSMPKVGITYEKDEELPFLSAIKKAIQDRYCKVDLVYAADLSGDYQLILSQTKLQGYREDRQIILAPLSNYSDNAELKKTLWSDICQKLSLLSSSIKG